MAFVPVPETVMAEIRMRLDNQRIENTLYFRLGTGTPGHDLAALGNQLLLWWNASYRTALSGHLSLTEIYLTDLDSNSAPTLTVPAPAPNPVGGTDFESMPNHVALCISFRTTNRGRSYRGRNYVSGLPENAVFQNTVNATTVSALVAAYNALPGRATTAGYDWVVVSRFNGNTPRAAGITTKVTSALVIDPIVDSQRRRLPGRGR